MKRMSFLVLAMFVLIGCAPQSDVDEANHKIAELQAKIDEKPALPVSMSLREAMMGPGHVAIFNTTIKAPVTVLVQLHSAALGTTKQFELHLEPNHATELGHMEGAVVENGDTIIIENQNYSSLSFTVSL